MFLDKIRLTLMTEDVRTSFLNEKPVKALVSVRRTPQDSYPSLIAKNIDTTYAHAVKVINKLEDDGYITTQKMGRKKLVYLTEDGEAMAELFGKVLDRKAKRERDDSPLIA